MGAGMDGGGASAMGLTSANLLSAVTGTGDAKVGLGRPQGLKDPLPPFAPFPAARALTLSSLPLWGVPKNILDAVAGMQGPWEVAVGGPALGKT